MWSWRIRAMLLDWLPYWAATVSKLTVEINYRNDEHCGLDVSVAPVTLPSLAGGGRHGRSVHGAG